MGKEEKGPKYCLFEPQLGLSQAGQQVRKRDPIRGTSPGALELVAGLEIKKESIPVLFFWSSEQPGLGEPQLPPPPPPPAPPALWSPCDGAGVVGRECLVWAEKWIPAMEGPCQ